jgi:hypothetical protein
VIGVLRFLHRLFGQLLGPQDWRYAKKQGGVKIRNFAVGLALLLLGTILWIQSLIIREMGIMLLGREHLRVDELGLVAVAASIALAVLGPILFWFVVPLIEWYRREENK